MDKLTLIIESAALGLGLIVFGTIILVWSEFSQIIGLIGQSKYLVGILCILIGITILVIDKLESIRIRDRKIN